MRQSFMRLTWVASIATGLFVFSSATGGCSSSTPAATDGGASADSSITSTPDTSTAADTSAPDPCSYESIVKACPNDDKPTPANVAELVALCKAESAGACGAKYKLAVACTFAKSVCGPDGKADFSPTFEGCKAENEAYSACKLPGLNDAGGDSASAVNGCTTFADGTGDSSTRIITWDLGVGSLPARCLEIKVGQAVVWNGDLATHPLAASGGDTPNPIMDADTITFPSAGTYGFVCTRHASMNGAIRVVP